MSITNEQASQLVQDTREMKTDIHQIKIELAGVQKDLKHNRQMNEKEHQQIEARLGVLEVADREQKGTLDKHQEIITKTDAGGKVVAVLVKALWGALVSGISGLAVYLLMR